ncbi:hypothetical protein [Polaromonas sp. A23]|uniref:hypothetical protein n=1 Tax=Polaromonas sp. A23 TaxID=1944133 RepID=UPI0009879FE2|nr:hypothetical protein [Polaromonas sp. A23]OOG41108.1 hypothetical protein B0B52_12255 [Polaromonas sp. A23]
MHLPLTSRIFAHALLQRCGYTRERFTKDLETNLVGLPPAILLTLPVWRPVLNSMKNWADSQHADQAH